MNLFNPHKKIENLEYGNIKEENKIPGDICPPILIDKYYTYIHDNMGHIYTFYIIMVMPCISFYILFFIAYHLFMSICPLNTVSFCKHWCLGSSRWGGRMDGDGGGLSHWLSQSPFALAPRSCKR